MHAIGSVLLFMNGLLCSYAASTAGLRVIKEPAHCSIEDFRALGLFGLCLLLAGYAFAQ